MSTLRANCAAPIHPQNLLTCVWAIAVLLTLEGCFFFRSKPDPKARRSPVA